MDNSSHGGAGHRTRELAQRSPGDRRTRPLPYHSPPAGRVRSAC